jgi:high-affinity nickel-transport protein
MTPLDTPTPWALLAMGLLLGLRHAIDPDHVVAVTAIAARTPRWWAAAWLGIVWGVGHTVTLFVVGSAIILCGWIVPPRIGLSLELAVAVALIVLGLHNVRGRRGHRDHGRAGARGPVRAFAVGLVHGLAGSAAVALLVLGAVSDPRWACAYLLVFGLGTIAGMSVITTGLAWPVAALAHRSVLGRTALPAITGAVSLALGLWLVYDIGWTSGLFLTRPTWTPH